MKWAKDAKASKYQLQRSNARKSGYKTIATVTKTKYTDKKIKESKNYYYRVKVTDKGGSRHYSNVRAKVKVKGNYKHGSPYGTWLNDKKLNYVNDKVANFVNVYTDPSLSDFTKALLARNYLVYKVSFADRYEKNASDAYGTFKYKGANCWGYSKAYKALCDGLGVPCKIVDTTTKGSLHEWNAVKIEGKWYFVDNQMGDYGVIFNKDVGHGIYMVDCIDYFLNGKGEYYMQYNTKKYPKISSKDYKFDEADLQKLYADLEKRHLKKK